MSDLWDVPQANKTIDEILQTLYHSYSGADGSKLPVDLATKDIEALITEAELKGFKAGEKSVVTLKQLDRNRNA